MYGTAVDLRTISQVEVGDLELVSATGQTEGQRLDEILEGFLRTAREYIELETGRNFEAEAIDTGTMIPEGIKSISLRLAANMVQDMIVRQDAKVVKRDSQGNLFTPSKVFTNDLKQELKLYAKGKASYRSNWPMFSRVRRPEEIYWDSQL